MRNLIRSVISAFLIFTLTPIESAYADDYESRAGMYWALTGGVVAAAGILIASLVHRGTGEETNPDIVDVSVNNIYFSEPGPPGQQELIIENKSSREVTINSIDFEGGAADDRVSIEADPCSHNIIHPTGICTVTLQATPNAYDGSVNIAYDYDNKTLTSNIEVTGINLELYEVLKSSEKLILPSEDIKIGKKENIPIKQTFKWKNAGEFPWQYRDMYWKTPFEPDGGGEVEFDKGTCVATLTEPRIAPGTSCEFTLTTTKNVLGDWGRLSTTGNLNLPTYDKNVLMADGVDVIVNVDPNDYHLGYRSLKIVNTAANSNLSLQEVTVTIADNKIKYCSPTDVNCTYKTDSNCQVGGTLTPGSSCKIWFKSQNNNDDNLYRITDIPISVKVDASGGGVSFCEITHFKFTTDQALYAGGYFTTPGYRIAKFDGTGWTAVGSGNEMNNHVEALISRGDNSDLYAGGDFTSPGNHLAKWNGFNWSTVGSNNIDNSVLTFSYNGNGKVLYIGGDFTSPGSKVARCDQYDDCAALITSGSEIQSGSVKSVFYGGADYLYVGGDFTIPTHGPRYASAWNINFNTWDPMSAGAQPTGTIYGFTDDGPHAVGHLYVGRWNGTWTNLGGTWNNGLSSILKVGGDIYVGGGFTNPTPGNFIVKYNGFNWFPVGIGTELNDSVFALTTIGNKIYVGGYFTTPGNRVALHDTSTYTWSPVGTTYMNGLVKALAVTTSLELEYDKYGGCP